MPAKMTGDEIFVQDMRPEGMLFGQVVRPPTYKAKLASLDASAAEKMPGVVKVVRNGSFIGVVAAARGAGPRRSRRRCSSAAKVGRREGPARHGRHAGLAAERQARPQDRNPQARRAPAASPPSKTVEATYYRPYHMHASIGTSCAIATLGADGVTTIQTHSQSVFETRQAIAQACSASTMRQGALPARAGLRLLRPQHGRRRGRRRRAPGAGDAGPSREAPVHARAGAPLGALRLGDGPQDQGRARQGRQRARLGPRALVDAPRHAARRTAGQPAIGALSRKAVRDADARETTERRTTPPIATASRCTNSPDSG